MSNRQLPLFPSQPTTPDEISKHSPFQVTLEHFREYLTKEGKSPHTVKAFMGDIQLLGQYSGKDTPVGDFTTTMLNEFLHWMETGRGVSCSRKTYARRVTSLKVYFKWLRLLNAIPHDPARAVLQRSGSAPLSHVLSPEQVEDVLEVARTHKKGDDIDARPEVLFRLLLQTGLKKGETGRLQFQDIDRSNPDMPLLLVRHTVKNIYKERRIALNPALLPLLDRYREQYRLSDQVFTCTTRNLEYILTALGKGADVPFKLSFEVLRWTMAVQDWRAGMEEERIREKMGLSPTSWYETSYKIRRLVHQQIADASKASDDHAQVDETLYEPLDP